MGGSPHPLLARLVLTLALSLGAASLLLFAWFLAFGPFPLLELNLSTGALLALDAGLSLVFFLQHSGMVRTSFRRRLGRVIPHYYCGPAYTLASSFALFLFVFLWQESPAVLVEATGFPRLVLRILLLLAGAGFLWAGWALHSFDPLGVAPLRDRLRGREPRRPEFVARGPYLRVRHPIYFFVLIVIWSYPVLTADRLLFNTAWTIWIIIGAHLEERDLVADHGETYSEYQRRVPMLFPRFKQTKEPLPAGCYTGSPKPVQETRKSR